LSGVLFYNRDVSVGLIGDHFPASHEAGQNGGFGLLVPASSSPMTFLIRDLISGKYEEPLLEGNQDEAVRADGSAGDGMNARLPRETSIRSCKLRAR